MLIAGSTSTTFVFLLLRILCIEAYPFLQEQVHCPQRISIDPCTCDNYPPKDNTSGKRWVQVTCQKMKSFQQVVDALKNKFSNDVQIMLTIEYSTLEDIGNSSFKEINASFTQIKMNNVGLTQVPHATFSGIGDVKYLSLGDNKISLFPGDIFQHMPNIETLEISRTLIREIYPPHFESLKHLSTLVLSECNLTFIGNGTFPATLSNVHLGTNNLTSLNRTLSYQRNVVVVQMQNNRLKTLDGELPDHYPNNKLRYLDISGNELDRLPETFKNLHHIDHLFADRNKITALGNALSKMNRLKTLDVSDNKLNTLSPSEFAETSLETLILAYNDLTGFNQSLLPLKDLVKLNGTHNKMREFSFQEIKGIFSLREVHLEYNRITRVIGHVETYSEPYAHVHTFNIAHNEIEILDGSMGGIKGLSVLNMSYNKLTTIPAQFLKGLNELSLLDISHNKLHSLQETSKAVLPLLTELNADYNEINILGDDLDGFPTLCWAHFSYNKIRVVKIEFSDNTLCKLHGVIGKLRIYVEGNTALCDESMKDVMRLIERRNNNTEFYGNTRCSPPKEELKYNVNNTDSSPITVITLDKK